MEVRRRLGITIALGAAALAMAMLISACGGDEAAPERRPAAAASRATEAGDESTAKNGPAPQRIGAGKTNSDARSHPAGKTAPGGKAEAKGGGKQGGDSPRAAQGQGESGSSCTPASSGRGCDAVGKAYAKAKRNSRVVETGSCPRSMDEQACKEAGEALEQSGEGRTVEPTECPPAMTDQQCEEAGRAYQEALK